MRRLVLCGVREVLACGERSHACRREEVAAAVMAVVVLLARLLAEIALVLEAAVSLRALSYCCCRCLCL